MGETNPACIESGRFFFSQHRRRAVEPDAATRNCDDVCATFSSCKIRFTGSNPSRSKIVVAVALWATRALPTRPRAASARQAGKRLQPFARLAILSRSIRQRFLNDCHEYVFHFTKSGRVQLNRLALGVPYQDKSNISRWPHTQRGRSALPREHVVRSLRNNSKSGERTSASGDVSSSTCRMVYRTAWSVTRPIHARSFSRHWKLCGRERSAVA